MTIIYFILILGITVFIHELGHLYLRKEQEYIVMNLVLVWDQLLKNGKEKTTKQNIQLDYFQ